MKRPHAPIPAGHPSDPLVLGIDPGVCTGYALAGPDGRLVEVAGLTVLQALDRIELDAAGTERGRVAAVVIEDARDLPIYARHDSIDGRERDRLARGVGHVDAFTMLLEERCVGLGLPVALLQPSRRKKWTAEDLKQWTGWTRRTNEHARDAARMVYGRSVTWVLNWMRRMGRPLPSGLAAG